MFDISQQIIRIEKEIRETPYHKGTEHHIGMLRARIARLRDKSIEQESKSAQGGGGRTYAIKKHGDATVVLVGPPSVGKSTLLNTLTNAESKVAPYAFTTLTVIPGMMDYKNARIQILDVPGLIEGAEEGKGRGREVLSVIRGADLLVIMAEPGKENTFDSISSALERNGIRINKQRPSVRIEKKTAGGIVIHSNIKQDFSKETVKEIAGEMGFKNGIITINENVSVEDLIDVFSRNRVYIPAIFVINKHDLPTVGRQYDDSNHRSEIAVKISAMNKQGLDILLEKIWEKLDLLNIYLVRDNEEPSTNHPLIMKSGEKLTDVLEKLGTNFMENKKGAIIWGTGAKFPGQEVSLNTVVRDGMQIRFF